MSNGGEVAALKVVIESPLKGDIERNMRYLAWCCRAVWFTHGVYPNASHLVCPWFMDDSDPHERAAGIDWPWFWERQNPHWFFTDFGYSDGMALALERCEREKIPVFRSTLERSYPDMWAAFQRGEWPPHTKGFEMAAKAMAA